MCILPLDFVLAALLPNQVADYGCGKRKRNTYWTFCLDPHETEKSQLVELTVNQVLSKTKAASELISLKFLMWPDFTNLLWAH